MKKLSLIVVGLFFATNLYAVQPPGFGSVQDNNDGSEGQILINTGKDHGNSDIGEWKDADFLKGEKGDKGNTGKDGEVGEKGDKGDRGDKGKDVDPKTVNSLQNQINKLDEPRYYLVPQVRIYDSKRLEVKPYAKFDMGNGGDFREAGLKVTLKIGKSHEEKLIEEQNEAIRKLGEKIEESISPNDTVTQADTDENVEYTFDNNGMAIGIHQKF